MKGFEVNLLNINGSFNPVSKIHLHLGLNLNKSISAFKGSRMLGIMNFATCDRLGSAESLMDSFDEQCLIAGNAILNSLNGGKGFNQLDASELNKALEKYPVISSELEPNTTSKICPALIDLPSSSSITDLSKLGLDKSGGLHQSGTFLEDLANAIKSGNMTGKPVEATEGAVDTATLNKELKDKYLVDDSNDEALNDFVASMSSAKTKETVRSNIPDFFSETHKEEIISDLVRRFIGQSGGHCTTARLLNTTADISEAKGLAIVYLFGRLIGSEKRAKLLKTQRMNIAIMPQFYLGVSAEDLSLRRFNFDKIQLTVSSPIFAKIVNTMNRVPNINQGFMHADLGDHSMRSRLADHFGTDLNVNATIKANIKNKNSKGVIQSDPAFISKTQPKRFSSNVLSSGGALSYLTDNLSMQLIVIGSSSFKGIKGITIGGHYNGGQFSIGFSPLFTDANFRTIIAS